MAKKLEVRLVSRDANDMVTERRVGKYASRGGALKASERAAGRGAEFLRKGVDFGYVGENGWAMVSE
jgi:hypothetical protein